MDSVIKISMKALNRNLCDHCLGRLFARSGYGLGNDERGKGIRTTLALEIESKGIDTVEVTKQVLARLPVHDSPSDILIEGIHDRSESDGWNVTTSPAFNRSWTDEGASGNLCWLCEDIFDSVDELANRVLLSSKGWDFDTFLIGCRVDPRTVEREQTLWQECEPPSPEPLKEELNRLIGKSFSQMVPEKEHDKNDPDIAFIIDPLYKTVTEQVKPVFIFGRYRKLARGIPQTRWPCRSCRGKGCDRCGGTGRMYKTSIEELIGIHARNALEGEDFKLHGMGREDVDVLSLGDGRPFVLEITRPRKRNLDLLKLENEVNSDPEGRLEVHSLRYSTRKEVPRIKDGTSMKRYRATISMEEGFDEEILKYNISLLAQSPIRQRTPIRVAHRRADKVRTRKVHEASVELLGDGRAIVNLLTDGGLYIKELFHGDEGRTEPSLSSLLGTTVKVDSLDVTGVIYDEDGGSNEGVESHGEKI